MNLLTLYLVVGLFLAYVLKHQVKSIGYIPIRADVKMRNKINKRQKQLHLYIKLCPVWPILLIKEFYDEIQDRRQT